MCPLKTMLVIKFHSLKKRLPAFFSRSQNFKIWETYFSHHWETYFLKHDFSQKICNQNVIFYTVDQKCSNVFFFVKPNSVLFYIVK